MLIETEYRPQAANVQEMNPAFAHGSIVAIGNFDGVHKGHQSLLDSARQLAAVRGLPLVVLCFTPHPRLFFKPDQPNFLLADMAQKHEFLTTCGVDTVVALRFDAALAGLSAPEFVSHVLLGMLNAKAVIVGDNFLFGKGRGGNIDTLRHEGAVHGFDVFTASMFADGGETVSSERIRALLRDGKVNDANGLLGRPWQLRGEVVQGHQRGRTIGFPTANLALGEYLHPAFGVYVADATVNGRTYRAAVNIGQRPTIGVSGPLVEAHLIDFNDDIYGQTVTLDLLAFIRPEQKFDDFDALKAQIAKDVAVTRAFAVG